MARQYPSAAGPEQLDAKVKQDCDWLKGAVTYRLNEWGKTHPKTAAEQNKYATEMIINPIPEGVLLNDGKVLKGRTGFPNGYSWTVYRITPQGVEVLKPPVRLRLRGLATQTNVCKEVFLIQGTIQGTAGLFLDIRTCGLAFGSGPEIANPKTYTFQDQQYAATGNSIEQSLLVEKSAKQPKRPATNPAIQQTSALASPPVSGEGDLSRPAKHSQ